MIGFECPWCDHQSSLSPQAFAAEAVICTECSTRVELSVGPATPVVPVVRMDPPTVGLALAA